MLERALEIAYRHLNRRERTESEIRQRLQRDGLDDPTIEQAVSALRERGHLDDTRYARMFAQDKRELDGWGSERIRNGLLARGIDRDVVEAALGDDSRGGEVQRALALLCRRFPNPPRDRRERERALGVLLRRGYDTELALQALASHSAGLRAP